MTATFIDTSFLLAIVLEPDAHHQRALAWQQVVTRSRTERKNDRRVH